MTWLPLDASRPLASAREAAGGLGPHGWPCIGQAEMARRLGIPRNTLASREQAEPSLQLAHLAQHLEVLDLEQETCETCGSPRLRVRRKIDATTTKGP